jgi:hypothetical protein
MFHFECSTIVNIAGWVGQRRKRQQKPKTHLGVEGFSAGNLWRMRAFHLAYRPEGDISATACGRNGDDAAERARYARQTSHHGWIRFTG